MILNVLDFGATGDGRTDDSAAIQAAIDAATGKADPATTSRVPTGVVYLPAGSYRCGTSLRIRSVQGFHLVGAGPNLTAIEVADGARLDSLLEIDGAVDGIFEAFTLKTRDTAGTDFVDKMFYLHWSGPAGPAHRSTSNNSVRDVTIMGGHFRTGFAVGSEPADNGWQCDGTVFRQCLVSGVIPAAGLPLPPGPGQPRNPTQWDKVPAAVLQNGWEIGNGTHGNNIDHFLYACSWAHVRNGLRLNASNATLHGSQPAGALLDLNFSGSAHPIVVEGLRSEMAGALLDHGGGAADSHVTLRNINWGALGMVGPTQNPHFPAWIRRACSGTLHLENVVCEGSRAGITPAIELNSPGGNALSCVATGVAAQSPVGSAFVPGPGTQLTIMNYHERDKNHAITAITPLRMMHGPKMIFEVPPAA